MPTFRVYYEYTSIDGTLVSDSLVSSLNTPDDVRKAALSKFKSLARDGFVVIKKIKMLRK